MKRSSRSHLLTAAAIVAIWVLVAGCSPSLSPLYRDYEVADLEAPIDSRIAEALQEAGWDTVTTSIPNAVVTDSKTLSHWGLYKVTASLEVTPLGREHVRVFVHPYREYITGGKGKIPYLTPSIRAKFLPRLNEAFEEKGLVVVGTPVERDEKETAAR